MKTLTTESTQYSAPVCAVFAFETMSPLCSSVAFSAENYEEEDYVWQIK